MKLNEYEIISALRAMIYNNEFINEGETDPIDRYKRFAMLYEIQCRFRCPLIDAYRLIDLVILYENVQS